MLIHGSTDFADDLARVRQRLLHQRGVSNLFRHTASEQVRIRTPGLQCGLSARRCDIGVMEPYRCAEYLQLARHSATTRRNPWGIKNQAIGDNMNGSSF